MDNIVSKTAVFIFAVLFSVSAYSDPGDLFVQVNLVNGEQNCSILKVSPDGVLSEFVSSEEIKVHTGQSSADCDNTGLAIDDEGNVYFSEDSSDSIIKVTPSGELSTFVTEEQIKALTGLGSVDLDNGMTIGLDGNLYFADEEGFVLRANIPSGFLSLVLTESQIIAVTGKTGADLQGGIVFDCRGNLYITDEFDNEGDDTSNDLILRLSPGGALRIFVDEEDIEAVTGGTSVDLDVGINFLNFLYVLDDGDCDCILKIDLDGNIEEFVTKEQIEAVTGGNSNLEGGIAISQSEELFIGDNGDEPQNPNILRVTQLPAVSLFVTNTELDNFYTGFEPNLQGSMAIEGVDACSIAQIPTMSEWGLVAMALVFGIVGFAVMRKRAVRA